MSNKIVPVSVIIPCFRCAHTIVRAIDSVVHQTNTPAEVILIDDCSGDETVNILLNLEKYHSGWLKVLILNENNGAANARNIGWESASQPYIAFLDADDSWHPKKIHIQYEYMRNHPEVALTGHQSIWLRESKFPPITLGIQRSTPVSALSLVFKNCFSTPSVMVKKNIQFRFSANKLHAEDLYLWQQIAFSGLTITRLECPLAYVHKALYGASGLSAQLWKMEMGELDNLISLYQSRDINWLLFTLATGFSIVKFIKRLVFTQTKRTISFLHRIGYVS